MGSSNEDFLDAFKAQPEYASFKGRMAMFKMPYIIDYLEEEKRYKDHLENRDRDKIQGVSLFQAIKQILYSGLG